MAEDARQDAADLLAQFAEQCRAAGLKVTQQRLEVLRETARGRGHPSAERILRRVRRRLPTLSLDTVYRTLALLERYGLVRKLLEVDAVARFDANVAPHHHAVCEACGAIGDLDWPDFDTRPLPSETAAWGEVRARHAVLRGLCATCLAKEARHG